MSSNKLLYLLEMFYDRGNHHDFLSLVRQISPPGELTQSTTFPFEFLTVDKPHETYTGTNVRLRYFVRVVVVRRISDIVKEHDVAVHTLSTYPDIINRYVINVGSTH